MRNCFYHYHQQTEFILQLALLPFTLLCFLIKKIWQFAKTRHNTNKQNITK